MIPVNNSVLFQDALDCLSEHKRRVGRGFKGRFIQIFLGLKYFQNNLPSMYSGTFITSGLLQGMLDDLYAKSSRPPQQCVLSLFENNFLARTGINGQNTWRNNLNIQKGIGCYAPANDLSSLTFLNEQRVQCRFLSPQTQGTLAGARCSLCTSGQYRREGHRKWLRIDPGGNGYATTDLNQIQNFEPYVAQNGNRIPVLPLIVALYYDSSPGLAIGNRTGVTLSEFMADFNISQAEFNAYFDVSNTNHENAALQRSAAWPIGTAIGSPLATRPSQSTQGQENIATSSCTLNRTAINPQLTGTVSVPPTTNSGWDAEQFVSSALSAAGWTTHDVSRQQIGYDILAMKGRRTIYVEVKSSIGTCSPSLTAGEWQRARYHTTDYILAVVEHFNPQNQNTIYWVPDPSTNCVATERQTISYGISRSSWSLSALPLNQI